MKSVPDTMHGNKIPEIDCAIAVLVRNDVNVSQVQLELNSLGIHDVRVVYPKCDTSIILKFAAVKNELSWDVEQVLTKMFSSVDACLPELKGIIRKYEAEVYIDVAFYQYGSYPALVFEGKNMERIHYLKANISIDPF